MAPTVPVEFAGQRKSKKFWQKGVTPMMGKARKISKGHSSGFVPDYRHVIETMGESEGFGSSGRVDAEMTASEDSCAPKRKCFSLNGDSLDCFGVPIQVLSLSKISLPERKDLELRLKRELEQIRILQKKISTVSFNGGGLSPSSDFHSCSNGYRMPIPETSVRSMEIPVSQGKKRGPTGRSGGSKVKKAALVRFDPVKQALSQNSSNAMVMKQCETLLNRLMAHPHAWVFNTPVDVVKLNIPDYPNVIKHPMDLGTVKSKLMTGKYINLLGFAADVRLTFSNAMTYNPPGNDVHIMAETLRKYFEVRWKPIEKKLSQAPVESVPLRSNILVETETETPMPPTKRKKTAPVENKVKQLPVKRVMSDVDKLKLSSELENLLTELPESIIDFLKESSLNGNQVTDDEIEIDIDTLSDDTLFTLQKLLDDYLVDKQKNLAKAESEMELHKSSFSNSSVQMQPCKANEPIDEDIDIGGNDLPNPSFPPVEIEKDTALRNSKCSSSSSSRSDSGSSSSDSDSGSSSGSDSDGAKTSVCESTANGTMDSEQQKKIPPNNAETENGLLNGLSQVEHNSQSNPVSVEMVDVRPEGESAPPERQVSPDKLYRAALLRSRFADTIIKAQEKTIGKGEKEDPERLRLKKEELEKRRREEKARLQAEAKAAEEAQRNAETEAAAEAKRKRELEREAARQALQKMEKTVEINENCQFMEDLEMLGVAPFENLPKFIDEATSPDHTHQDILGGSFKFQGNSNPLEQLGLYRKDDYDDEEEGEPKSTPAFIDDDPEEGEID